MSDDAEREALADVVDLAPLPIGTILRDEVGRVFVRRDAQVYRWRTILGPGFDLSDDQAMTCPPVRVLFQPEEATR